MDDEDRFVFDLRNALTPLRASMSLLAREWDSLNEQERKDLTLLAHEQVSVLDAVLRRESARRGED